MNEDYKALLNLYVKANELMAKLGADGEVNAHQKESTDMMNALYDLDGGAFNPDKIEEKLNGMD